MCRALRVLCAAPTAERLSALRRAAVSASWELVGGATSADELAAQVGEWDPDVVVVDAPLGPDAVRSAGDRRVVVVDAEPGFAGAHAVASLESLRSAVLGLPPPVGPVRS